MILLLMLASVASQGSGELFTSMAHLQRALYTERDIAKEIRHYIYEEQERLLKLEQLADEFDRHSANALKDPELYMSNPVNAYLFVKHFTLDWDNDIDVVIKNNNRNELHTQIEKMREHLPTYEDLAGSVSALLRLQDTYTLETTELARGNIGGFASPELSARDCFELGHLAHDTDDYYHTIMWMEEALAKVQENDDVNAVVILDYLAFSHYKKSYEKIETASKTLFLHYLPFSSYKQGNVRRALTLTNEMLTLNPEHNKARDNKDYYEKVLLMDDENSTRGNDDEVVNKSQVDEYRNGQEFAAYEALCRNESIKTNKYQHNLFCRYRTNNHPLLVLSPAKEEVLYLNPFLSVFYDSISDREINVIKDLAIPRLGRSEVVVDAVTNESKTAYYRVSKSCWLTDYDSPDIAQIHKRIAAITGLSMDTAEELQIANYGIGGQYEPHLDYLITKQEPTTFDRVIGNRIATFIFYKENKASKHLETGDRIATFMFYLSDVQAGGATVFPYLGLKVFPEKGKAVFWYNLYKNGQGISDTLHGACPVLIGSKWVSNKWIHERGQEFRRPCGLQESE